MDVELIEIEPHTRGLIIALVLLGLIGYAVVRRWPRSFGPWLALGIAATIVLTSRIVGLLRADMGTDFIRYLVREVILGTSAVLVGIGLPLWAHRQSRSRPAA